MPTTRAELFRRHAEEARATIDSMTDPEAKREMSVIAAAYERLANRVERAAAASPSHLDANLEPLQALPKAALD